MASFSLCFAVAVVGPVVVVVVGLLSKVAVGPGPSYGSSDDVGLLNIFIISCDMPSGLFGAEDLADGCEPVCVLVEAELAVEDVDLADVCGPAGVGAGALADDGLAVEDADLAGICGPVRALAEALGAV